MKNLITIFMFVIVISNILDKTAAAKRIKRESGGKQNHTKIAEDFVVLKPGNNNNDEKSVNLKTDKVNVNTSRSATEEKSMKTPIIHEPLAFITPENEQLLFKHNEDPQLTPIVSGTEPHNSHRNEKAANSPLNPSAASNADDTFVYHSMSPFAPIDQMMRFANMLLYKKERDDTSSTNLNSHSDAAIENVNSFGSSVYRPYFIETPIALAQSAAKTGVLKQPDQGPISRIPIKSMTKERPMGIMDLFGKAFLNPIDNEVEIFCPLHTANDNLDQNNYHYSKDDDNDVIQVCSCHLIKSLPDNANKEHK